MKAMLLFLVALPMLAMAIENHDATFVSRTFDGDYTTYVYRVRVHADVTDAEAVNFYIPDCSAPWGMYHVHPTRYNEKTFLGQHYYNFDHQTKDTEVEYSFKLKGEVVSTTIDIEVVTLIPVHGNLEAASDKTQVEGPSCTLKAPTVCNAGNIEYIGTCENGMTEIQLDGSGSQEATSYVWSAEDLPASAYFEDQLAAMTKLVIPGSTCKVLGLVRLTLNGGEADCTARINVDDVTPPVITLTPDVTDTTVPCGDLPAVPASSASDNCDSSMSVNFEESIVDNSHIGITGESRLTEVRVRTWSTVDSCGNVAHEQQTIVVVDYTPPNIVNVPSDADLDCSHDNAPCEPEAVDECDHFKPTLEYSEDIHTLSCDDSYNVYRSWLATDGAGNTVTDAQTIRVRDTVAPNLIGVPDDYTLECPMEPADNDCHVTADDNCDADVDLEEHITTVDACGATYVRTHEFIATDNCANSVSDSYAVTVEDTTPPVLTDTADDRTIECQLAEIPEPCDVKAVDACDGPLSVEWSSTMLPGPEDCTGSYAIEFTFHAVDSCGNDATDSHTVTVVDTTPPEFDMAVSDIDADCIFVPFNPPKANDDCEGAIPVEVSVVRTDSSCPSEYILERTYFAADDCGNSVSAVQIVNVTDGTDPSFSVIPSNLSGIECDTPINHPPIGVVDLCDGSDAVDPTVSHSAGSCPNEYTIIREYSYSDCAGNSIYTVQTVGIVDTTPPTLENVPANQEYQIDALPPSFSPGVVTATDECGDATVDFTELKVINGCVHNYTIYRTWTATDECGNTDTDQQTVDVYDTEDPTITDVPYSAAFECDDIPDFFTEVNISDNSEIVGGTFQYTMTEADTSAIDSCDYSIYRSWSAVDECGNDAEETQTLLIKDTTDPFWTTDPLPAAATYECTHTAAEILTADDACHDVTVSFSEVKTPTTCDEYTLKRTWYAEDECGNDIEHVQNVVVEDTEAPTLYGVPGITTVSCDNIPPPAEPTANDTCEGDLTDDIVFTQTIGTYDCDDSYWLVRTWTVKDCGGLSDTEVQSIYVEDVEPPVFDPLPDSVTINCTDDVPDWNGTACDNCDDDVPVLVSTSPTMHSCGGEIIVTFSAKDDCDNSVTDTRTITIVDNVYPYWDYTPPNDTVECIEPAITNATASDDCGDVDVTYSSRQIHTGDCPYDFAVERKWVACDPCSQCIEHIVTITVDDTTPPVWDTVPLPSNVNTECDETYEAPALVASDNCGDVTVEQSLVQSDPFVIDCPEEYSVTHSYIAVDECGNDVEHSFIETVQDTEPPVISDVPTGDNFECDIPARVDPNFTDNCDSNPDFSFTETSTVHCVGNYDVCRSWYVEDNCGNFNEYEWCFTVDDTTPPYFLDLVAADDQSHDDDCSDVTMTCVETQGPCPTDYVLVKECTIMDDCGNDATWTWQFTVEDTTPPFMDGVPDHDQHFECDDILPDWASVNVSAHNVEFDDGIEVDMTMTVEDTCTGGDGQVIIFTWHAEDCAGNENQDSRTIYVDDTEPPTVSVAADDTIDCADVPSFVPSYDDNCDENLAISQGSSSDDDKHWYEVCAEDNCGNTACDTQTLTIVDTEPPALSCIPTNQTVTCGQPWDEYEVDMTATDNCGNATVAVSQWLIPGSCPCEYTLVWAWEASDGFANTNSTSYSIAFEDNTPPYFIWTPSIVPISQEVQVDNIPRPPTNVKAYDNEQDEYVDVEYSQVRIEIDDDDKCFNLTRTWYTVDECGNENELEITLKVCDHVPPTIIGTPADVNQPCTDDVPDIAQVTFLLQHYADEGTVITVSEHTEPSGVCPQEYEIYRTWEAVDPVGNVEVEYQTISVYDNSPPIMYLDGAAVTTNNIYSNEGTRNVYCDDDNITITANDTCIQDGEASDPYNVPVVVSSVRTPGATPQQEKLITTFTATDDCGNQAQYIDTQIIEDSIAPYWTTDSHDMPNDVYVNCTDIPPRPTLEADDNCSYANVSYTETPTPGPCGEEETIERCYIATDSLGNQNSVYCYTVYVVDNTPPTFDAPITEDYTNQCDECVDPPNMTANDICDGEVPVTRTVGHTTCEGDYDVVYEASDECGNSVNHTITVTVEDNSPPTFYTSAEDITVNCSHSSDLPAVVVNDTCDESVDYEFSETMIDEVCDYEYKIVRTYYAEDCAQNSAEFSYTITVTHSDDLEMTVFPDELVTTCECDESCVDPNATASSLCGGNLPVSETIHDQGGVGEEMRYIHVFHADDTCDSDTQYRTIYIVDTTPPEIVAPPSATADCETFTPGIPTLVHLDDNCDDDPAVSASEWIEYDCPGNYTVYRKWVAEDANGNTNETTQTINVYDISAPVFEGPITNRVYDCDYQNDQDMTANDTCGNDVTVYFTEMEIALSFVNDLDVIAAGANPSEVIGAYVRTWLAIDECGLQQEECDTAYVVDTDNPDFDDKPDDVEYPCDAILPIVPPTPTDPCDPDPAMNVSTRTNTTCPHEYEIYYTWTVTDWVNHHNTHTATLTVYDDEPPTFDVVPPTTSGPHECDAPSFDDIAATDNCDNDPQTNKWSNRTNDCGDQGYTEIRSWRAVDDCGNERVVQQTVEVVDSTPPTLYNVPGTISIECDEFMPSDPVTADDDCALNDITLTVTDTELPGSGSCTQEYTIVREWIATDPCGNNATDQQTVKVYDTTPPTLSGFPVSDLTLECNDIIPDYDVTACDICDADVVTASFSEEVYGPYYNKTYIRYWYAPDECENQVDVSQTIYVMDMTPPYISAPDDTTVDCILPAFEDPVANDTCDDEVIPVETMTRTDLSCPDSYWLVRDWYVADDAGNSATAQQSIRVKDTTAPITADPRYPTDSTTVECTHEPSVEVNWTDDCGEVSEEYSEVRVDSTDATDQVLYTIYRIWTAADECGNDDQMTETITVQDTTPPMYTEYNGSLTFECDSVPVGDVTDIYVHDNNCSDVTASWSEEINQTCPYNYTITRTFWFEDDEGNSNTTSIVLSIYDTTDPEIHDVDESDVTLEYGSYGNNWTHIPAQTGYDTDNCGTLTYTNPRNKIDTTCPEVFSVVQTFTAIDECANQHQITQTTYVVDTTPPRFTDYPDNITVECDAVPDVCDVEVENEDYDIFMSTDGTASSGSIIYTWYAEDCSGNGETHTQTVTIVDTAPPVLTRSPEDEVVPCDCDTFPAFVTVEAIDNCEGEVKVESNEVRVNSTSEDEYQLIRTWEATDGVNTVIHSQTVTVFDDVPPEIDYIRQTIWEQCDEISAVTNLSAWDNCDPDPVLLYSEVKQTGSCPETYQLLRNWESFDRSGNAADREQTVFIHDSTAPTGIELNPGTCIYPANGNFAKYEDASTSLFNFADNCDEDYTVSIISCNSTQITTLPTGFSDDCFWDATTDVLWIKAERDSATIGRTYQITIQVTDGCTNTDTFTKDFFVPHDDTVYEDYGKCCDEADHENAI